MTATLETYRGSQQGLQQATHRQGYVSKGSPTVCGLVAVLSSASVFVYVPEYDLQGRMQLACFASHASAIVHSSQCIPDGGVRSSHIYRDNMNGLEVESATSQAPGIPVSNYYHQSP